MRRTFELIIKQIWPMLLVCSIIMIVLRIAYLIKNKKKIIIHHEVIMFVFIIYMMCLFYVVTFQDIEVLGISRYNLIPFKEMFRYPIGSYLFYKNVIGNMLMFVPFGFFTAYILNKVKLRWVIIITLIVSLAIEFIQLKIGRVFDIDDVILNVMGGIVGYIIFSIINRIFKK